MFNKHPHRWESNWNKCSRCNLSRKAVSSNKQLKGYYIEYFVNGKWTIHKPPCIKSSDDGQ